MLITSGCSSADEVTFTSAKGDSTNVPETIESTGIDKPVTTSNRNRTTPVPNDSNPPGEIEYNNSTTYTDQFSRLANNDSLRISELNVPYNGSLYDNFSINVTNIRIEGVQPDDQNILIISHDINDITEENLARSVGKISLVFGTVLRREAVNDEGDWNVSQARILTYEDGSLLTKNRIEFNWAGAWVFQLLNWETEGYVNNTVFANTVVDQSGSDGFPSSYATTLESNIEIESVNTNITGIHANQSRNQIFFTYTTATPPTETHMYDHMDEYRLILNEYGALAADEDFGAYNRTTLFLEEVYEAPNETYDTRRVYTINSTFAQKVYNDEVSGEEIAQHMIDRAVFEDDAYYE
jgi:hypothetical protein